ncbi:MAG: type II secretion system F family protein [Planctomycetota bacterium]|nr:MAG: type II secretion system F family protein [Planctomycetota bacterium]
MPIFEYEAITVEGRKITGVMDADTSRDAAEKLRQQQIHVTRIIEVKKEDKNARKIKIPFFSARYDYELTLLTRQFATLLRSGIPQEKALGPLIEQVRSRKLQTILRDIREKITGGLSLKEALEFHRDVFNDLYINMIHAGELAGNLPEILTRLADYLQAQSRLRNRISAALAYPIVMIFLSIGVVIFLVTFVVPKVTKILEKQGKALPLPTQILLGITNFIRTQWWLIILIILFLSINFILFIRTDKGRLIFDTLKLKIPIVGEVFRKQAISRFSVTFSALLRSGIAAHEALKIVEDVVGNRVLANVIADVHEKVIQGADISTPLQRSGVFPPVIGYMIEVGEQSGQLGEILERISEAYDEEIEMTIQKMVSLLEPLIIIFMASIVGFIVISIILPLTQVTSRR